MDWIEDGDRNTSFFDSIIGTRAHYNIISQVTDHQGNIHSDHAGIENTFLNYYKDLWSAHSTPNISREEIISLLLSDLPTISSSGQSD